MAKFIKTCDLSIILAAVLWGCISLFTRPMQENGLSSSMIVAVRAVTTTAVMFLVILIKDRSLLKIRLKDLWMFLGTGIASFLFFNVCYMSSIGENSVSVACMLMYTSPIWVTLFSALLFKERLTVGKVFALLICIASCAMLCLSSSLSISSIGLVYGLLSGLGYGLYSIFGKFATKKYSTTTVIFYTFAFASLGAIPICNIGKAVSLFCHPENILLGALISVFCTILPYMLYTYGLSKTEAGKAAVLSIIEPVVAAIVGFLAFGENPGIIGLVGVLGIVAGIILLEKQKN